jgi:hypothetical protein
MIKKHKCSNYKTKKGNWNRYDKQIYLIPREIIFYSQGFPN